MKTYEKYVSNENCVPQEAIPIKGTCDKNVTNNNYFKTITGGFLAIIYKKKSNYNMTQGKGIRLIVKVSCINRDTHFHTKHAQSYIQTKDIDSLLFPKFEIITFCL